LALAFAACPRAIAVTDSILVAGLPPGETRLFGGAPATLGPQGAGIRPDGTIAGAGIILDEGIRRLIAAGIPPETAYAAATSRPATALGLTDRGTLAPGLRADLVWWSDDFAPLQTWTAGHSAAPPRKPRGTETARAELADLDERPTLAIVQTFLAQEQAAQRALANAAPALARLADAVAAKLQAGGRLFYAGAGTSGRLGLLDAVECGPTFGIEDGFIVPLLAGGTGAFIRAAEGAEDDEAAAITALTAHGFSAADALVGIAASGTTPFTLAALRHAASLGGLTGAIVNNANSPMAQAARYPVELLTGAEVIAGSTRLSAGSAQKIALNTLSSTVMIRLGKTYGPYMVDMRASNAKLRRRALAMLQAITGAPEDDTILALSACNMHVKRAALMLLRKLSAPVAEQALAAASGSLRRALRQ
jgi:N-acetylmuramic acid 6-phosphate etherase